MSWKIISSNKDLMYRKYIALFFGISLNIFTMDELNEQDLKDVNSLGKWEGKILSGINQNDVRQHCKLIELTAEERIQFISIMQRPFLRVLEHTENNKSADTKKS